MSKAPTLREFLAQFPTEESCLDHLFQVRYGKDFNCPKCSRPAKYSRVKSRRAYQCNWCAHQVYPTAGTPFDRTRTPLRDWFFVMFQFTASRNGVAAKEVQRQLGVTYKTAWRMCHEIREYMGDVDGNDIVGGPGEIVELDETYVGGKPRGLGAGKISPNKMLVLGMMERGGNLVTKIIPDRKRASIWPAVSESVAPGSILHTDELASYGSISLRGFRHQTVNHSEGTYVSPKGVTVNGIEGAWSALKRGINGTHIHVSAKHLSKYLGEFEYRHNMRHVPHLMLDRLMVSFSR
jgi:transposase-like protein